MRYLEERVKDVALLICSTPVATAISAFSPGPPASLPASLAGEPDARRLRIRYKNSLETCPRLRKLADEA